MKLTRIACTLCLIALCTATGCRGGRGGKAEVSTTSTTVGQELMDLDAAHSKGLITDSEYQKKRKEIMESD
jgi:hypothetical protein